MLCSAACFPAITTEWRNNVDREQIQEIIFRVLSEFGNWMPGREPELEFPVEVSAKHVHLTDKAVEVLFGKGKKLTPKRPLSQPGQFLSEERVTLVTPKGRIENVAVLGPERPYVQVELSATDARTLGVKAPLKMSGDLNGAGDVYIIGPEGVYDAKGSAIVAQAHIHLTPDDAAKAGVSDGQRVSVTIRGERPATFENVICRVSSTAGLAMHIDYDEANACMLPKNATAKMRLQTPCCSLEKTPVKPHAEEKIEQKPAVKTEPEKEKIPCDEPVKKPETVFNGKLITEAIAKELTAQKGGTLTIKKGVIVTPSAKDIFSREKMELVWETGR